MNVSPRRIRDFQEALAEVARAAVEMREALAQSNDENHQTIFSPVLGRLGRILGAERDGLTQYIADELMNVRSGIRRLRVPDIDPVLEVPTPSLKILRSARGNFVESLDNALEAAATLRMLPRDSDLGQIRIERAAFGEFIVRLDERLRVVEESLDDLQKASRGSGSRSDALSTAEAKIVGLYVQKIGIEVDAARFETNLAEEVDVPALGRAVGVMHDMGKDLSGTLDGVGQKFTQAVQSSGHQVVRSVVRGHGGFKVVVRWAKRTWNCREKLAYNEKWSNLERAFSNDEIIAGVVVADVKGGFRVDLEGIYGFLPRNQADVWPGIDPSSLINEPQPFRILKMDRRRGNIVVSRRAALEEELQTDYVQRLVQNLEEGQVIDGVVKNIADYGAFVDLGGIGGLLHVTDIAWRRLNHPTEILTIGQTVKVKIIKIDPETHRISLGMKQLLDDPWQGIEAKYPLNARFTGRVTNITDYGVFVELEPGIEGLIHVSQMSWTKRKMHPGRFVSTAQEVEVQVLEVDSVKRRISLGLKQAMRNPWEVFVEKFPVGSTVEGEVIHKTEFGLFLELEGHVDGFVHFSDLDWTIPGEKVIQVFREGDMVKAVVLDVDVEKERISLGVKQLDVYVSQVQQRYGTLSPRELQVMQLVTAGKMNKQVAGDLGISEIAVKIHRGHVMRKMGARTLADLVRMAEVLKPKGW